MKHVIAFFLSLAFVGMLNAQNDAYPPGTNVWYGGVAFPDVAHNASGCIGVDADGMLSNSAAACNGVPVANVVAFGADTTGVKDSAPSVRNALASILTTGGVLYFPSGNYTLSSVDPNYTGTILDATASGTATPYSGIHVECEKGANITIPDISGAPSTYNIFTMGQYYGLQSQTGYSFTSIPNVGATNLTLTTPSDANNFSVGQPIYIMGGPGTESQPDGEINWVTSVNSTTGVIGLLKPTSKPFTGTGTQPFSVVPAPSYAFAYNLGINGCNVNITASTHRVNFLYLYESIGTRVTNNTVTDTSNADMFVNSYFPFADLTISGNVVKWGPGVFYQVADGQRDITIDNNDITTLNAPFAINPSQGTENVTISNNRIYSVRNAGITAANAGAIVFSTAYNVNITGNQIQFDDEQPSDTSISAILTGLSNGACHRCAITGNYIQATSSNSAVIKGITLTGGSENTAIGNVISTTFLGIENQLPNSVISNNFVHLLNGSTGDGIRLDVLPTTVVSNTIYGDVPGTGTGIYITPSSGTATVQGNIFNTLDYGIDHISTSIPDYVDNQCTNITNTSYCGQINLNNYLYGSHFLSKGVPSIVCGTGAGSTPPTGANCAITGNDDAGSIYIVTTATPAANAAIFTVTLGNGCPVKVYPSTRSGNVNASSLTGNTHDFVNVSSLTANSWQLFSNTTGLTAATTYQWIYSAGCN